MTRLRAEIFLEGIETPKLSHPPAYTNRLTLESPWVVVDTKTVKAEKEWHSKIQLPMNLCDSFKEYRVTKVNIFVGLFSYFADCDEICPATAVPTEFLHFKADQKSTASFDGKSVQCECVKDTDKNTNPRTHLRCEPSIVIQENALKAFHFEIKLVTDVETNKKQHYKGAIHVSFETGNSHRHAQIKWGLKKKETKPPAA